MFQFVSDTASYGNLSRGPVIIDEHVRGEMRGVLEQIRSGQFAKEWLAEHAAGRPRYSKLLKSDLEHPIETTGRELRACMSWLQDEQKPAEATP